MWIDLSVPPLRRNVDAKAATLRLVAGAMIKNGGVTAEVDFVDPDGTLTAKAYWLLNLAFKKQTMEEDSLTNKEKRAALQSCAVMLIRPFAPKDEHQVGDLRDLYANQQLAISWGAAVIGHPRIKPIPEERRRFFKRLETLRFPSLDGYVQDVISGKDDPVGPYDIILADRELMDIDSVIFQFESFSRLR